MTLRKLLSLIFFAAAASGCTSSSAPAYKAGQMPLAVDPARVIQLDIAKADPKSGDTWATSLKRSADHWEVAAGPGGKALGDRRAAQTFILHLLDTLKTLQVAGVAPEGPAESFGLKPPRFALRWIVPTETGDPSGPTEIEIGAPATSGAEGTYARIGSGIYAVKGATLTMLDYIQNFSALREQVWLAPLSADDIDEIELSAGKRSFYAQREGDVWTDRRHKRIPPARGEMDLLLEHLTHARVEEFLDAPETAQSVHATIERKPLYLLILRDRQGKETRISLQWVTLEGQEAAYGYASSRPQAVVRVFSETMRKFEALLR